MAMDTWSAVEMLRLPGALPGYMRRAARTRTPRFGGGGLVGWRALRLQGTGASDVRTRGQHQHL